MTTEHTQSKSSSPSAPQPATQPETESDAISRSIDSIERMTARLEAQIRASAGKSDPGSQIDQQILLQAAAAITNLKVLLEQDWTNESAHTNLIRSIALLERIRTRLQRGEHAAARDALRKLELQNTEQRAKPDRDDARDFLLAELAGGERPAKELFKSASELGIAAKTLKRAKTEIGIHSRLDCSSARTWRWSLPSTPQSSSSHSVASSSGHSASSSPHPSIPPQ